MHLVSQDPYQCRLALGPSAKKKDASKSPKKLTLDTACYSLTLERNVDEPESGLSEEQSDFNEENEKSLAVAEDVRVRRPSMYKVVLLNDDYTPMDFVIAVLIKFFGKSESDATQIMYAVHQKGRGICGVFPYDLAETKARNVCDYSRSEGHPLQAIVERED